MLIQHFKYVTSSVQTVKFLTASAMASAAIFCAPMTAQASPGLDNIVTEKYSAKFNRALFETETGLEKVYSALLKKAQRACTVGRAVNDEGEVISKAECISDMLNQFVESADVTTLTAYHLEQENMSG